MSEGHRKDFDSWNEVKKKIDSKESVIFCNQREIWWCSIGINVGSEEDGKNELFERPVVILGVFYKGVIRVAPLTGKIKEDEHHVVVNYSGRSGSIILSQTKTISTKRLSRKLCRLDKVQFDKVLKHLRNSI